MKTAKKINTVLYMRTATENANGHNSIISQEKRVRTFAEAHGFIIGKIYADNGYSGLSPASKLPKLKMLFADARNKKIDTVIVSSPDRISRDTNILAKAIRRLKSHRTKLITSLEK